MGASRPEYHDGSLVPNDHESIYSKLVFGVLNYKGLRGGCEWLLQAD